MPPIPAGVPCDIGQLWTDYYDYVTRLVRKSRWFREQDVEDTASEIMTRLIERDIIGMYDADRTFSHADGEHRASFKTFLTGTVNLYMKGLRDRSGRQRRRESLVADKVISEDGLTWMQVFGPQWLDDHSLVDADEWVAGVRGHLAAWPPRSGQDRCDLLALFDELLAQLGRSGEISPRQLQRRFRISPTTQISWLRMLREVLGAYHPGEPLPGGVLVVPARREVIEARPLAVARWQIEMGRQSPQLRGVTPAQAKHAASVLRKVTGQPHVKGPLERARSPLAAMDYHAIARAERATYGLPKLKSGDHHRPAGHVLRAVVHYLDRVVADAEAAGAPA